MKRLFSVALGILTAIGGFVDIGDIVANSETGARFGMSLAWVVVVGVIGICLFAEMAGRVATVSGRAVFDLVRERLGARVALVNLMASFFITFLTLAAEIGVVPQGEGHPSWWFFAIALLGAAMTPYEVFFFSSGAVEEGWSRADLITNRLNVYIGFPLGGLLSLVLMASATLFLEPRGIEPGHLSQVALPTVLVLGKLGLAVLLVGFFAATFGAALETGLSCGYSIAQYFGFQWGKFVRPAEAPRFHLVTLVSVVAGAGLVLTTLDPITVTEYSIVLSAAALPLTYFPILVVANDPDYMGDKVNSRFSNALGSVYLLLLVVVAVVTIPLMILTKAGS
jgi:Mn2+/Fe2+ NRAMP family transporter